MVHISRKFSSIKLIKTGVLSEFYLYKFPISYDFKTFQNDAVSSGEIDPETAEKNIKKSANRARNNIRRLITGNLYQDKEIPKFLTTTFKENLTDLTQTNYHYKKFIQRLEYKLQRHLHYVTVHEKQERGAIHYHSLFFNLPKIDHSYIQKEWGGHVWIKNVYKTKGLFSYLTKYLTKSFEDETLKGKKRYFQTLVNQPFIIREQREAMGYYTPLLIENNPVYTPTKYSIFDKNGVVINEVTKTDYITIPTHS
jgi:hypothetical protein